MKKQKIANQYRNCLKLLFYFLIILSFLELFVLKGTFASSNTFDGRAHHFDEELMSAWDFSLNHVVGASSKKIDSVY